MTLKAQRCPEEYISAVSSKKLTGLGPWVYIALIGPPGTGKTYQLWALHRKHVTGDEYPGTHTVHIASECSDIDRHRYDWNALNELAHFDGVMCVDDIGYKTPTEWNLQALYHIANHRRANRLKTIWTTNLSRDALATSYTPAIASRILGGIVVDTGGDDRRAG